MWSPRERLAYLLLAKTEIERSNRCTLNEPRPSNPEPRSPPRIYRGSRQRGFFDCCANASSREIFFADPCEDERVDLCMYDLKHNFRQGDDRNGHVRIPTLLLSNLHACFSSLRSIKQLFLIKLVSLENSFPCFFVPCLIASTIFVVRLNRIFAKSYAGAS